MLHIAICDDEKTMAAAMEEIIAQELEHMQIDANIRKYYSGEDFLEQHGAWDEELIFMDIEMPGISGIDVIEEMDKENRARNVVLITAHDHMVLEHLSCAPFLFVRKRNMETDIPKAVRRFVQTLERNRAIVEFSVHGAVYQVREEDILYFEKYRQYITVHRRNAGAIRIRGSIQEYERHLSGRGFVRCHSGYLANLGHCSSIDKMGLILDNKVVLPISRDRKKYVMQQFLLHRR